MFIGACVGGFGSYVGWHYLPPMMNRNTFRVFTDESKFRIKFEVLKGLSVLVCALISACVAAFHSDSPMSTRLSVCGTVNAAMLLAVVVISDRVLARLRMLEIARENRARENRRG
jgi:peptidoglycan/LPS O-acetylase OafA/YrhL